MIRGGHDLREARRKLGWTASELGAALSLAGISEYDRPKIHEMESGAAHIPAAVADAVWRFLDGWRPSGFERLHAGG